MRLTGGVFGLLSGLFDRRTARLDKDRDQHHLASMLISIAAAGVDVSRADVVEHLHARGYSSAEIKVRMAHATQLAGTAVSGVLYDSVVALAREFG